MQATLSSKGQVVLPRSARDLLRLKPGTRFECRVEDGEIILKPDVPGSLDRVFVKDKISGLVVSRPLHRGGKTLPFELLEHGIGLDELPGAIKGRISIIDAHLLVLTTRHDAKLATLDGGIKGGELIREA